MSKIFKLLFSRVISVALAVIIQFAVSVYFIVTLIDSFAYYHIFQTILGILVFIFIVNERTNPEQKLVWAFLIIIFPIAGILLYAVLYVNKPTKKSIEKYTNFPSSLVRKEHEEKEKIYELSGRYEGQIKYIEKMSKLTAHKNSKCTYLKDGKTFYKDLMQNLKEAKKFIFMEYFIINHGKMWNSILDVLKEKVKEGLDVRIIYDDLGCATYLKSKYAKELHSYGIKCYRFGRMIPLVSSTHNNRDHRKICIIDGIIGYTGGINISDEYMNLTHPYGHWKDNSIKIEGEAVDNLTIIFLQNYALTSKQKQNYEDYLYQANAITPIISNEIIVPYGSGPKSRYYENFATDVFLNMISQAKKSIDISTPYLIIDYALTNALIDAVARGVKVRILIPSKPDKQIIYAFSKQTAYYLSKSGIEIYTYTPGFNHAKSFLVDDEIAFVGTTNLDFRSLMHHYECGTIIYNSPCLKDIDINFENDYTTSKLMSSNDLKTNLLTTVVISFFKIFQSLL